MSESSNFFSVDEIRMMMMEMDLVRDKLELFLSSVGEDREDIGRVAAALYKYAYFDKQKTSLEKLEKVLKALTDLYEDVTRIKKN